MKTVERNHEFSILFWKPWNIKTKINNFFNISVYLKFKNYISLLYFLNGIF